MRLEDAIGWNVARLREAAGLSQAQLGEALGAYLGKPWSRQAVSAAEKGRRAFTAAELVSLALVLKASLDHLLLPGALSSREELLPGDAEITEREYERAIVGRESDGDPSAQALQRANGALLAAVREGLKANKALRDHLLTQALMLDQASYSKDELEAEK